LENKTINLQTVAAVAKGLKELRPKMVFVGGAVISLYTDDEAAEEIRPTGDIDLTIQISGYAGWVQVQERLCQLGFTPDPNGHAICSYLFQGISVDIMPSEDGPLGPSNRWYKPGFESLKEVSVNDEITIQILSAPYFLATKLEAFNSRGGDYRTSPDFEDIVYVIDNRISIVDEVLEANEIVKTFIQNEFLKITSNPYLEEVIRAQIHPLIVDERYPIVLDKIKKIST
jgi:hypothetical protein